MTRTYVLEVPFDMRAVASASGARWDPKLKATTYTGSSLPPGLEPFRSSPYSIERRAENKLNGGPEAPPEPTGDINLRPHQEQAADLILEAKKQNRVGFLLADEVGLGKTFSALGAIKRMPGVKKVLIVSPLAVVPHWRNSIDMIGPGNIEWLAVNYERLPKLVKAPTYAKGKAPKKTKTKNKHVAERGDAEQFDVIIWDESHRCRHPSSQRSKMAVRFNLKAKYVLWLSATAGQNPLELSYLAPLLAQVTGAKASDLKEFEVWCMKQGLGVTRGNFGKWEWAGDPKDCDTVHEMLFEGDLPAALRRRPEDIAGWPEITRIPMPAELDAHAQSLYETAWTEFRSAMGMAAKGKDSEMALVALLRFRQKASLLRVNGTVELACDLLDNGHQVAISVAFIETMEAIREALEKRKHVCATIHGGQSANEKEAERKAFQRGDRSVVLFTPTEGISLHAGETGGNDVPRSQIIHDVRWSAIEMAQIEGRTHRDGQFSPMYWMYGEGTREKDIIERVSKRVVAMKKMQGDDTSTMKDIEDALGMNLVF